MDLTFEANNVTVAGDNNGYKMVKVEAEDIDEGDVLGSFSLEQVIDHFGTGELLDEIGKKEAVDHYGKEEVLDDVGADVCCEYFDLKEKGDG